MTYSTNASVSRRRAKMLRSADSWDKTNCTQMNAFVCIVLILLVPLQPLLAESKFDPRVIVRIGYPAEVPMRTAAEFFNEWTKAERLVRWKNVPEVTEDEIRACLVRASVIKDSRADLGPFAVARPEEAAAFAKTVLQTGKLPKGSCLTVEGINDQYDAMIVFIQWGMEDGPVVAEYPKRILLRVNFIRATP